MRVEDVHFVDLIAMAAYIFLDRKAVSIYTGYPKTPQFARLLLLSARNPRFRDPDDLLAGDSEPADGVEGLK